MKRALVFVAVMATAACGPQMVGSRYIAQAQVTPSAGGTLAVNTTALSGLQLVVPPGAVDSTQMVTVEFGDDVVPTGSIAGPSALLGPSGLIFHQPATLTLPLNSGVNTTHLFIQGVEENGSRFQVHPQATNIWPTHVTFPVLGFTTFQPAVGATCSADTDCALGQSCQEGVCAELDGGQATCTSDSQCGQGAYCIGGTCIVDGTMSCTTTDTCPVGMACINGVCATDAFDAGPAPDAGTDGGLPVYCLSDSDCPSGQICADTICVSDTFDAGPAPDAGVLQCITATDCPGGELCVNGVCTGASDGGRPNYLAGTDLEAYQLGMENCGVMGTGTLPNSTEADIRANLPGIWARCTGSVLPLQTNEVGIEFTDAGTWNLIIDDGTGPQRVDSPSGSGTWTVINNSQTNMTLSGDGGTIIPHPAFTASPRELSMNNNGVYQGRWATWP
jgi:Cys-rich repeat protein